MKNLLVCQNVCPVVSERDHEIACLKQENASLRKQNGILRTRVKGHENRIARVRQAALGYLDSEIGKGE